MRTKLLTAKEQKELVVFRNKIINRALSTEPIDRERAEQTYNDLLNALGVNSVSTFYWFDSPYEMHKELGGQLGGQLRGQLGDQLWGQLRDQLRDQLGDQLGDQLWGQLDQSELQHYMWMDYAAELEGVEVDQEKLKMLKLLSVLGENAFWILPLKDAAAFCERPIRLVMRNGVLDYDHDAAIEFKDGWKLYYLNGVNFDEATFRKVVNQEITLENLATIENADQRAVAIQYLRADRLLEQVGAKKISAGKRGVELYEVPNFMDTGNTEYCMKLEHPSMSGKYYIEWVEPKVGKQKDADYAMAVSRGISVEDYLNAEIA